MQNSHIAASASFYTVGGTLPLDDPSYVPRAADAQLVAALRRREFCYVLAARQMGKSSLMLRAAQQLEADGDRVAVLDLQAIGQAVSAEQWYGGLLLHLGRQLDVEDELGDFWAENTQLGPLQRWMEAIHAILRPAETPLVLFVDEIDIVRRLPFSAEELFAGIQEGYTRRAAGREVGQITFCLLGVASPTDLIRDPDLTPFNVGVRIDLPDFTPEEAAPLAEGWGEGRGAESQHALPVMARVLHWTNGHPYLTQALCRRVAEASGSPSVADVDGACEDLFLSDVARERDPNLVFVRDQLLRRTDDLATLLSVYRDVLGRRPVRYDEADATLTVLGLSGVVRRETGRIYVRNRIYGTVFDRAWITEHMPDVDLRRERAAYRRGMLRTAAVSTVLVVVLATLSTLAHVGRRDARNAARESQLRLSHSQAELGVRLLQEGDASGLLHLVDAHDSVVGMPEEAASRRKLWSGWYAAYAGRLAYIVGHKAQLTSLEYNATGTLLATDAVDGSVRVWHADTGKPVGPVLQHGTRVRDLTFSPDSTMLAVGTSDGVVSFWNPWTGASYGDPIAHDLPGVDAVVYVSFSADGQYLATTGEGYVSKIWDVAARASSTPWTISHERRYPRAFFAPGGTTIVVEQRNRRIPQLWDVSTRALIPLPIDPAFSTPYRYDPSSRFIVAILPGNKAQLFDLTTRHMSHEVELLAEHDIEWARASDDGRVIAGALRANASRMPVMQLWDAHTGEPIGVPVGYDSSLNLYTMRFSPDGRWVAVAAYGHRVRLIDTVTGEQHGQDRRHPGPVVDLIFSPDSTRLAVGARGGSVWVWNTTTLGLPVESVTNARDVRRTTSSPNGRYSAEANVGRVGSVLRVRQAGDGKIPYLPTVRTTWLWSVAFSPDSRWMAAAYLDGAVWVTEVESGLVHGDVLIHPGQAMAVAFEPSSSSIVVAARRYVRGTEFASRLHLWDHQSGEHLGESQEFPGSVAKIAFAPGGDVLAMMLDDEARPQLWDVDTWRQHDPLPVAQGPLGDIVFHPTLPILAAASADLSVHLWDISTGEQVTSPLEYADAVSTLAFNGDGSLLAAGTVFGKVHIWETTTWRPYTQTLARPGVTSIRGVWFRDGRIMTTDSHDSDLVTHSYSLPTTADPAAALDLLTYAAVGSRGGAHRTVEPLTWQAWQSIQTRLGERRSRLPVSHPGPRRTAISSLETTASGDLVARVGSGRLLWNAPKERWEPLAEAPPPSDLVAVGRPFALGALATIPRWLAAAVLDTGPVQTSGIPTDWIADPVCMFQSMISPSKSSGDRCCC